MKRDDGGQKMNTISPPPPQPIKWLQSAASRLFLTAFLKLAGGTLYWNHIHGIPDFPTAIPKPF
jgi:hypothetical protein